MMPTEAEYNWDIRALTKEVREATNFTRRSKEQVEKMIKLYGSLVQDHVAEELTDVRFDLSDCMKKLVAVLKYLEES